MLAPFALTYGKRWYHITASFAFGQDILRSSRELLKEAGGTEVGSDEVPLNTADFSSFILKIRQAKPAVVVGGLSAGDLSTFLKQWNELGMKGKIPFVEIAIGDTDIWAVGPEAATGTFTKMWDHTNPNNPPEEKAFAAAYLKEYGKPAADKAWMGWITARSLFESIDAAKSTDSMAIVEALEAWKVPAGKSSYSYRKFDHQMLVRNLAVTVSAARWADDPFSSRQWPGLSGPPIAAPTGVVHPTTGRAMTRIRWRYVDVFAGWYEVVPTPSPDVSATPPRSEVPRIGVDTSGSRVPAPHPL